MTPRSGRECAALHCERLVPRPYLFCGDHWWKVPIKLRNRMLAINAALQKLAKHSGAPESADPRLRALAGVSRLLAVRAVAVHDGFPIVDVPEEGLHAWRTTRTQLHDELDGGYETEVAPYRERLRRLMEESGGNDPVEVAAIAMRIETGPVDAARNARRIAAALDLVEQLSN